MPEELTPELAEETGLHIGDGSMNFYENKGKPKGLYQLRGHIIDDREHYETRIKPLYKSIYNIDLRLRDMPSTGVYGFQIWSNTLVKFKHKILGLTLGNKFNIRIPKFILTKDELVTSLIRGIFDTDGCLYLEPKNHKLYPRVQFSTVSPKLAVQIEKILIGLGLRATRNSYPRKEKNMKPVHTIAMRGEDMLHKFFKLIQPANSKHVSKYNLFLESHSQKHL
ncbi:hypothetical protein HYT58_01000 [Candidatus Woesearchaeota archaeon]|nr:hypothetical protein [Candidatus Woesearchaeota archaeon]